MECICARYATALALSHCRSHTRLASSLLVLAGLLDSGGLPATELGSGGNSRGSSGRGGSGRRRSGSSGGGGGSGISGSLGGSRTRTGCGSRERGGSSGTTGRSLVGLLAPVLARPLLADLAELLLLGLVPCPDGDERVDLGVSECVRLSKGQLPAAKLHSS